MPFEIEVFGLNSIELYKLSEFEQVAGTSPGWISLRFLTALLPIDFSSSDIKYKSF